jgi:FecR protein/SPOR domain
MKKAAALAFVSLLSFCGLAAAQGAVVEAVQYPAWLERGGAAVPLTPGTPLRANDQLRTGSNARVQLKMSEGSTVKLGENAKFIIDKTETRGVFTATLSVIAGAFRFTTDALRKVKNVTAGIRGTDLWGKSTDERDLVCLLEGKIAVGSEGHPSVTLDQPLDFYQRPRGGDPSVAKVDEKQIAIWALETELSDDGPGARVGGDWRVTAAAFPSRDDALAINRRVRASGYPSEVVAREGAFLVQIGGLAGEPQARALMANLRTIPGIAMPVIQPR